MTRVEKASGRTAVIVVDLQADFTTAAEGPLAVPGTDHNYLQAVEKAVRELKEAGLPVIATQDAHPPDHVSFGANHPGRSLFETIELADGRSQTLWPVHCVQESEGARVMMDDSFIDHLISKGGRRDFESYSAFADDGGRPTGLADLLESLGAQTLIVFGMAIDFCLGATVRDALAAGYKVIIIEELCLGISEEGSHAALAAMAQAGAQIWPRLDAALLEKLVQGEL